MVILKIRCHECSFNTINASHAQDHMEDLNHTCYLDFDFPESPTQEEITE